MIIIINIIIMTVYIAKEKPISEDESPTSLNRIKGINFWMERGKNKDQKLTEHKMLRTHPWKGGRPNLNITETINKGPQSGILFMLRILITKRIEAGFCEMKYFTASLTPLFNEKLMSIGITHNMLTSKHTHWIKTDDVLILIKIIFIKSRKNPEEFTTIIIHKPDLNLHRKN